MLASAIQKTQQFDRTIRRRNWTECVAAAAVTLIFASQAWRSAGWLVRGGNLLVAAAGLWIIFVMIRFGRQARTRPQPEESLECYRRALLLEYDHQIRLLRSVKYWYLLPPYAGLMLIAAGAIAGARTTAEIWANAAGMLLVTAVFGGVWWLNEGPGVRRLQAERARLLADLNES